MSVMLAMLLLLPATALQDDPDAAYREQYATFTEISQMTDPSAQCRAYLDLLEAGVVDQLVDYVAGGALGCLQGMTQARNYDGVYPAADRLARVHPASAASAGALALDAAANASNAEMIVKYGEPFYRSMPSSQIALLLTQAYGQIQNQAKMLEYGQIVLDSGDFPLTQIWAIAFEILQENERRGQSLQAVALARQLRSGLTTAPTGLTATNWRSIQVYLLDMIARDDFDSRRWAQALASFNAILELEPRNDKALYFKGNAMLQSGGAVNQATQALAQAAVLEGNYAGPAMSLLQSTFASNAPGATADRYVQEALAAARRTLGL